MAKLAGFPMYDFPELRPALDAFWMALHAELNAQNIPDVPLTLFRPHDLPAFWSDHNLLLGQTCGYPLMFGLCGDARYVATPSYKTRFSSGNLHKSLIIVHRDSDIYALADAQGKICAINMADSNTGMNLLRLEIAKLGFGRSFFSRVYETLAHRKSMHAVAKGEADIASIDCVTFALIERIDPSLVRELRILAETEETPNLPFITSSKTDDLTRAALQSALHTVVNNREHRDIMQTLMLEDIHILQENAYNRVCDIEQSAIQLGYPTLI